MHHHRQAISSSSTAADDHRAPTDRISDNPPTLTIDLFCALYHVSRAKLYKLWAANDGPKKYKIGKRTYIRTSAAEEWIASLERESA